MPSTRNALISVYHKAGIVEFAQELTSLGFSIYASGGTARHLSEHGVSVTDVADLAGGKAILGHRVVTLSRGVHAALLSRPDNSDDTQEMQELGIPVFDLVCVDLYPLAEELANPYHTKESVVEKTDIGGPTMIRSGVKGNRLVVCDPNDRSQVIAWLKAGEPNNFFKEALAAKGEFTIADYCLTSARFLGEGMYEGIVGSRVAECKYGENRYQTPAALYETNTSDPLSLGNFYVVEGTDPSYNNWCDLDRLLQTITHIAAGFKKNVASTPLIAVGAKHGNPCGAATGADSLDVLKKTLAGDPLAIFGGLIITNFPIGIAEADVLSEVMLDGVIAPSVEDVAIEKLRRKGNKCRFIVNNALNSLGIDSIDTTNRIRSVRGGFLHQPNYTYILDTNDPEMKKYSIQGKQNGNIILAWAIGSTSNSNTITLVKDTMLIGNGVGQQDRVGAAKLALTRAERSGHNIEGACAYSDSFFPFPDAPEVLIDAGVTSILTTSGSMNDPKTIELCKERNVTLYMIPDALGRGFFAH